MARLPGERLLMQQIGGEVFIFEDGTEQEILRFDPHDATAVARAQRTIHINTYMTDEEKCFAHFWSGYFYHGATT